MTPEVDTDTVCYNKGKFVMTKLVLWELWMNTLNTLRPLIILMNNTSLCCPHVPQWHKSIYKLFSYSSICIGWIELLLTVTGLIISNVRLSKHSELSAVLMSWINSIKKHSILAWNLHNIWPLESTPRTQSGLICTLTRLQQHSI